MTDFTSGLFIVFTIKVHTFSVPLLIGFTLSDINSANNSAERHGTMLNDKWVSGMQYLCIVINEPIV